MSCCCCCCEAMDVASSRK
uniref:Uncharacterized protein n=1 Tax=Arundo donax TaxID=35708 RepID=A0A0A9B502_ARUDO